MELLLITAVSAFIFYCLATRKNKQKPKRTMKKMFGKKLTDAQKAYLSERNKSTSRKRMLGIPAYGLVNKYGRNGTFGEAAEIKTALLLRGILNRHHGAYVLNNFQITPSWDIDHIVVTANSLILIDTKNWSSRASYAVKVNSDTGAVLATRNGEEFLGGKIALTNYIPIMQKKFPGMTINGIINIDCFSATIEDTSHHGFKMVSINELLRTVDLLLYADTSKSKETFATKKIIHSLKQYITE